ncbi:MAG: hypothetical protein EOO20_05305 [Chryseobacterium sp.]|nr:MAG: hypothetical protein EOO20_05305 [Chryseobacterium sp.]
MNVQLLKQYGVIFYKQSNGIIVTNDNSKNLDRYLSLFSKYKPSLKAFLPALDIVLSGQFNSLLDEDKIWYKEFGYFIRRKTSWL